MTTTESRPRPAVLDLIGNTPLLRVSLFDREVPGVEILAKAEWLNPGGSVKDRAAARMIAEGERTGALRPGKILFEMEGVTRDVAKHAMQLAADKLPLPCKLVSRFGAE